MRVDKLLTDEEVDKPLTSEEADTLWDQYVESFGEAQRNFDSSLRALAAGGIAISATLAAAFGAPNIDDTIAFAVVLFLASLLVNLVSYWIEQWDATARLRAVRRLERRGAFGSRWQSVTAFCNYVAGLALLGGGAALAVFVFKTTS